MRLALLSDIHSNVFALEAVIADAQSKSVDVMANLGDILYGPIAPKATYEVLIQHDFITISGNQDRQIVEATPDELTSNPTLQFIVNDLGNEPIAWMKSLAFDHQLSDDIYLCHGTPQSDLIYLLEDVSSGTPQLREDKSITELLAGQSSSLICCGHTHIPRTVTLTNGQTIVNPGSVGLQAYTDEQPVIHSMQNYCHQASYSVVEKTDNGWRVDNIKVPYDIEPAVTACEKRGRSDWAHFLQTGRAL